MIKEKHFLFDLLNYLYKQDKPVSYEDILSHFQLFKNKNVENIFASENLKNNLKFQLIRKYKEDCDAHKESILQQIGNNYVLSPNGIALYQDYIDLQEAKSSSSKAQEDSKLAIDLAMWALIVSGILGLVSLFTMWGWLGFHSEPTEIAIQSIDDITKVMDFNALENCKQGCIAIMNGLQDNDVNINSSQELGLWQDCFERCEGN